MTNTEIQESLLEIIEQLTVQKRKLKGHNEAAHIESDPEQVDIFSENKLDALNFFQNLLTEKFSEYLPENTETIKSKEYDVFKNGLNDALQELDELIVEHKHKKSGDTAHPSAFDKGIIEGVKRASRVFRRKMHELI